MVVDCGDREFIGGRLSCSGKAAVAEAALEDALIKGFGLLKKVSSALTIGSDSGFFTSERDRATASLYNHREFFMPYAPEENGVKATEALNAGNETEKVFRENHVARRSSFNRQAVLRFRFKHRSCSNRAFALWC